MAIPANNTGPQKTFWNTYAFHPGEAKTWAGGLASAIGSIALFCLAPVWGHTLAYFLARKPFIAKTKESMSPSQAVQADLVDRVAAKTPPLLSEENKKIIEDLLKENESVRKRSNEKYNQLISLLKSGENIDNEAGQKLLHEWAESGAQIHSNETAVINIALGQPPSSKGRGSPIRTQEEIRETEIRNRIESLENERTILEENLKPKLIKFAANPYDDAERALLEAEQKAVNNLENQIKQLEAELKTL